MEQPTRVVLLRPRTVLVVLALSIAAVLLLLFLYATRRVLIWMLIALFLALALDQIVSLLERRTTRMTASLITFACAVLVVAALGYLLVPPIVTEVTNFVEEAPKLWEDLSKGRGPFGSLEREFNLTDRVERFVEERGAGGVFGFGSPLLSAISTVATGVIAALSIMFLTVFLLLYGPSWKQGLLDLASEESRPHWERMADGIYSAIGGWVLGALLIAFVAGGSTSLVLWILGVPYALALGVVVGVLDPLPFIGATLGAAVAGLATLATEGWLDAVIVVGFLVAYQNVVENNLLVPVVYARTIQLSPLAVIVAVLLGGELAGVVGALAAIPIAGSLKVVAGELLAWKRQVERRPLLPLEAAAADQEPAIEPISERAQ
ncbi:MAG: AI-2E family transporter [Actinomycetota bacterium]|nr:AI-2E family transporter [Actinomycetota bacterium]